MRQFLFVNGRWLAAGFLLLFSSSFGQTFFISLSGGAVRQQFGLSNGEYATLYMAATLASALTLVQLGRIVDRVRASSVVALIVPMLALGAVGMAYSVNVPMLLASLFVLRLFGQGMLVHTAYTTIGRWFAAGRGRAVSMSALGLNTGQAVLPFAFVTGIGIVSWQGVWLAAAALLMLGVLPLAFALTRVERIPDEGTPGGDRARTRDWTRKQVLADPCFYLLLLGMLPPAFISNTIFFHQVHLAELRGWGLDIFAAAFALYAAVTVLNTIIAGQLVDRYSAVALLPFYLLPFSLACLVLGLVEAPWAVFAFMVLYGISDGFSLTLFGSLWPEVYGTRHLGSIRAVLIAVMVFASAFGPGLAGILIDLGLAFPLQIVTLGFCCLVISFVMYGVSGQVQARRAFAG